MRRLSLCLFVAVLWLQAQGQLPVQRPKLVVGLVVDQMRWDYLYRYADRLDPKGGFRRMLNQGFSCENTLIPYAPTVTACGHSSIYSGSVPSLTGITGNFWWDNQQNRSVYCTEDKSVKTVGGEGNAGQQSPRNMLVTTICDELRMATNFQSKVIGIAMKDRGGILPAGHSANAAYWFDNGSGKWISSTYYMNDLPAWVTEFNGKQYPDAYYRTGWSLLYPAASYRQSSADEKTYEAKPFGGSGFPYDLSSFIGKDYSKLASTPMGNSITAEFAKAALVNEKLGADSITDFLAISFSSTDYIGHSFGPNSVEAEDAFLRLDKELGSLFDLLDQKVGKNQYLAFLSADHGVAHIPEFMTENKMPGGRVMIKSVTEQLNRNLAEKFKVSNLVLSNDNYQLSLNQAAIDSAKLDKKELTGWITDYLAVEPGIDRAFPLSELNTVPLNETVRKMLNNGWHPSRSGDIQLILKPGYIDAFGKTGTTHGLWNPYDAHIPLLWYGWKIKPGKSNQEVLMTDIAPTIAALLRIQMPSGCVGKVIGDVVK